MSDAAFTVERDGHVLLMGFNRPEKRNAFDVDTYRALAAAYGELDRDPDLRVGLLFGHGDHFDHLHGKLATGAQRLGE